MVLIDKFSISKMIFSLRGNISGVLKIEII